MADRPVGAGGRITRRQFLSGMAIAAGVAAGAAVPHPSRRAKAVGPVAASPSPRVVHVYSHQATAWDYATGWYGDYVRQGEVNKMVDQGLMALTGTASRAAAWQALIPGYVPGQRVAIKANLVNAGSLDDGDNDLDALIEPVNSLVAGLLEIGVAETDIWVYDASRTVPDRFRAGCAYPGLQFSGLDFNDQGFSLTERVIFDPPDGGPVLADQRLSQVLVDAHYLINLPIMKKHSHAYVTLSFKNHYGTIETCRDVHDPTFPGTSVYRSDYNPLVDIYQHPHVGAKTVLTVGDGLFGNRQDQMSPPAPWVTFGDQAPNSLFFSCDPVAIDCVMYDFLAAEAGVPAGADDYLALAAGAGLGTFEHRAPGVDDPAGWYSLIDYVYLDLSWDPGRRVYLPAIQR